MNTAPATKPYLVNIDLVISIEIPIEKTLDDSRMNDLIRHAIIQRSTQESLLDWMMENIGEIRPDEMTMRKGDTPKKVTELNAHEAIHCPTLPEAITLCKIMHEACLTWSGGQSYLSKTQWDDKKENTVYYPAIGAYGALSYAIKDGVTVYAMSEIITPTNTDPEAVAYEEGRQAWIQFEANNGKRAKGNPYEVATVEFAAWNRGFNVG